MIRATGTTTAGFFQWTVLLTAAIWFATVLAKWFQERIIKKVKAYNFVEALKDSLITGIFIGLMLVFVVLVSLTYYLFKTVYYDHQLLVSKVNSLTSDNSRLEVKVEEKRQNLDVRDPAFLNMTNTIQAFMIYRRDIGPDASCMILTSSLDNSYLAYLVMVFGVIGANCPNGNLLNIGVKPQDLDVENAKGEVPSIVVLHALPESKGVDRLVTNLGNLFQVRRSYKMPSKATSIPENTIWLQFGTNAKWNSQLNSNAASFNPPLPAQSTKEEESEREKRRDIRERLARFIPAADNLWVCYKEHQANQLAVLPPEKWKACERNKTVLDGKIEAYIRSNLDSSYLVRFKADAEGWFEGGTLRDFIKELN